MNYGPPKDIEFYDFSGGVNYSDSEYMLAPNELSGAYNVLPTSRGALTVRKGLTRYNDTIVNFGAATYGLIKFYREASGGTDVIIMANGEAECKFWQVAASGASTDLGLDHDTAENYIGVANATEGTQLEQYRDRVYAAHGTGSTANSMTVIAPHPSASTALLAWQWGVTAPTKSGTYVDAGSGTSHTVGTYKYKFTSWYGEDGAHGESNPGPAVTHVVAGAAEDTTVTLWSAVTATHQYADWAAAHDDGVDKVYIYRTKVDADVYYYAGEATSGLTWLDNVTDAELDPLTSPPSDNYTPDNARHLCFHEERAFIGNLVDSSSNEYPSRVRWSMAGYPDIFPNLNYVDAPAYHGAIMGLKVLNGILYVFFESAIGAIRVYGEADAEFRIVSAEVGPIAVRTLVVGSDAGVQCAFYLGRDRRVYRFDGASATPISRFIDTLLQGDEGEAVPTTAVLQLSAAGWDGRYYHLSYGGGLTVWTDDFAGLGSVVLRYDTHSRTADSSTQQNVGTWWPVTYKAGDQSGFLPTVFARLDGGSDSGTLIAGSLVGAAGEVIEIDSGYSDDFSSLNGAVSTIPFSFATGRMNLGIAGHVKSPRRLLLDKESADDVTLKFYADASTTPSTTDTSAADTVRTRHNIARIPCRQMKFEFSGTSTAADSLPVFYGFVDRFDILRED